MQVSPQVAGAEAILQMTTKVATGPESLRSSQLALFRLLKGTKNDFLNARNASMDACLEDQL
jgi:hypothetical protein